MQMIVKATKAERFNHWILMLSFFFLLLTGLGFTFRSLSWVNTVFGGVHLASSIHKWGGVVFGLSLLFSIKTYLAESLNFSSEDWGWFKVMGGYFSDVEVPPQGRLNAGQKLFYLCILLFGTIITASGLIIWLFPFSRAWILAGHLLHNISVVVFAFAVPLHVYLTTAANPGTFRIMTRGTVPLDWAKKRHSRWIKERGLE